MKKIIITITLLLIVGFSGLFYFNNQKYQVEDISYVEIVNSNETISDEATLSKYLPLLSQKRIITDEYDFRNAYDLVFNMKNDTTYHVKVGHDFDNKIIYFINDEKKILSLTKDESLFFFKDQAFKGIYKQFDPGFTLLKDNNPLKPSSDEFFITHAFEDQDTIEYSWENINKEETNTLTNPNGLTVNTTNSSTELLVYDNNELVHKQTDFSKGFFPEYNGSFKYIFQVKSNHQKETHIEKTVTYQININRQPVFELSHDSINQGHFLKITGKYVNLDEIQSIETLIIEDIKFYKAGHEVVAFIPIHARTKPNTYDIKIKTENKYEFLYSVDVVNRDFKTQYLNISASTIASTSNAEAYAEYNKYFHPVRKISSEKQYYDDHFIMPLKGRITTEFGEGRYINNAPTAYSHSGLDLSADKGTPVHAINHGVVTLSRHFATTGNSIIIDHGQGLLSYYLHLDTLNVAVDDQVTTGDLIGTVGSTGRSTGAHLHFGTSFYTTYIEPGYFIYGEPITKDNYKTLFQ